MWIIKWIISALIILVILFFAFENQNQMVSINFWKWQSPNLPLYLFLYIAFGAGLLFWVLISALNTFKLKGEITRLKKENRKVKDELNRLRNFSLEEDVEPVAKPDDSPPEETMTL